MVGVGGPRGGFAGGWMTGGCARCRAVATGLGRREKTPPTRGRRGL